MKLTLTRKLEEAKGTMSFFWKPDTPVRHLPGQFYYFTLPKLNFPDSRGATRHITISSSPTEGELIRFTTRVRKESGYKKTLYQLNIGDQIDGEGPNGTFILNDNDQGPHVFIAGGIGITPFRCMVKYASDKKLGTKLYLLYSNSIPEEITFKEEMENLTKLNSNFKLALTVTKPEELKQEWGGLTGRIDRGFIESQIENWKLKIADCTFWVCGPPSMVDSIETTLIDMGIASGNMRVEKFTGY